MTKTQKKIITTLLNGGSIAHLGAFGIRLRDAQGNPIVKVNPRTFWWLRDLIKKDKKALWIISRRAVMKLHKNTWIRHEHKRLLKANKRPG